MTGDFCSWQILLQKSAMDGFRRLARTCLVERPPIRSLGRDDLAPLPPNSALLMQGMPVRSAAIGWRALRACGGFAQLRLSGS